MGPMALREMERSLQYQKCGTEDEGFTQEVFHALSLGPEKTKCK